MDIAAIVADRRGDMTREAFLKSIGVEGVSLQTATRWARGDIRNLWIPILIDRLGLGAKVARLTLAERLNVPVRTAASLALDARRNNAWHAVLGKALNCNERHAALWCALCE